MILQEKKNDPEKYFYDLFVSNYTYYQFI